MASLLKPSKIDPTKVGAPPATKIISRVPLYLSQEFSNTLHLFQSPLRDPTRPYSDIGPLYETTFKPFNNAFEFSYELNPHDIHFNQDAHNQVTTVKINTNSSRLSSKRTNYVVGRREKDAFILYPLFSVHKLSPSLAHIDALQQQYDAHTQPAAMDDESFRQVQMRVKRGERVGGIKKITHDSFQQQYDEEPAAHCVVVPSSAEAIFSGHFDVPYIPLTLLGDCGGSSERFHQRLALASQNAHTLGGADDSTIESFRQAIKDARDVALAQKEAFANRHLIIHDECLLTTKSIFQTNSSTQPASSSSSKTENSDKEPTQKDDVLVGAIISPFATPNSPELPLPSDLARQPAHTTTPSSITQKLRNPTPSNFVPNGPLQVHHVVTFMRFARCASFPHICRNLGVDGLTAGGQLLQLLKQVCWIVHGNFVLRSEHVYNQGGAGSTALHVPNASDRPGAKLQRHHAARQTLNASIARLFHARNFIIWSFAIAQNPTGSSPSDIVGWRPFVSQRNMSKIVQLGPQELVEILDEVAIKRVSSTELYQFANPEEELDTVWEFTLPIDLRFLSTFPGLVRNNLATFENMLSQVYDPYILEEDDNEDNAQDDDAA